jgi:hypothetical protein
MRQHRRMVRRLAALGVAAGALALGACSAPTPGTPPPTSDPSTPWLAPGCIDSSLDEGPIIPGDFQFSGVANVLGNGVGFTSTDGTCSGEPLDEVFAVVRAANGDEAVQICEDLGLPVENAARLVDFGFAVPIDAWTCLDPSAAG